MFSENHLTQTRPRTFILHLLDADFGELETRKVSLLEESFRAIEVSPNLYRSCAITPDSGWGGTRDTQVSSYR